MLHRLSRSILFLLCIGMLSLTGCSKPVKEFHETVFTMGTLVEVTIVGEDEALTEQAYSAILDDFNYMHNTWHPWQRNALMRVNGLLKTGATFSIAPSIMPLIKQSQILSEQSQGLFNPAIGQLIKLWGFHQDNLEEIFGPPEDDEIKSLLKTLPKMNDIKFKNLSMFGTNEDLHLDFGGFAKGMAVDATIEHLKEFGIQNAIINAGGDLRAIGKHGERPWRIGIRDPRNEGVFASVEISGDESVFTSGDYERFFTSDGTRYHHIIDPRTGYPATQTRSVTIIHGEAATADAAATALFIAGPEQWHEIAQAMGIKYVMLIASNGDVHMNPAMAKRIEFTNKPSSIKLSQPL
ncbi:MAG: FAD:protein FMN transferase [Sulfuriflexus sp.]|nr:FAD:protein FMN transferase [Sulfuriflexus sp.]